MATSYNQRAELTLRGTIHHALYTARRQLEYDDIGNGVPLLLIHAFPLDRTMWRAQVAGLQLHYRVIAPDLRGFGHSATLTARPCRWSNTPTISAPCSIRST